MVFSQEQIDDLFKKWWDNECTWTFGNLYTTPQEDKEYERQFRAVARSAFTAGFLKSKNLSILR